MKEFVLGCDTCKRSKHENIAYLGLLQPLRILEQSWTSVWIDFIEGLPKFEGKDCVMVVVDRLTKYAHFCRIDPPLHSPSGKGIHGSGGSSAWGS